MRLTEAKRKRYPTSGRLAGVPERDRRDLKQIMAEIHDGMRGQRMWEYPELGRDLGINSRRITALVKRYPWAIIAAAKARGTKTGAISHAPGYRTHGDSATQARTQMQGTSRGKFVASMGGGGSGYEPAYFYLHKTASEATRHSSSEPKAWAYSWDEQKAWVAALPTGESVESRPGVRLSEARKVLAESMQRLQLKRTRPGYYVGFGTAVVDGEAVKVRVEIEKMPGWSRGLEWASNAWIADAGGSALWDASDTGGAPSFGAAKKGAEESLSRAWTYMRGLGYTMASTR